MSTDRDMLELAAKAAGIAHNQWDLEAMRHLGHIVTQGMMWNPLTDDGDALRLAVKLDIPISPESCNGTVWICRGDLQIFEALGVDSGAAVRRAIVRAAAEIGRTMP